MSIIVLLLIFMISIPCVIFLQIFLSRRYSKWPGLILPALSLIFSIIVVMEIVIVSQRKNNRIIHTQVISEEIQVNEGTSPDNNDGSGSVITLAISCFLLFNISTVVLLGIYWVYFNSNKKNKAIGKINTPDVK